MGVEFNRFVGGDLSTTSFSVADSRILRKSSTTKMIFMSHKTGDSQAEALADHIYEKYGVFVYMVEWDDDAEDRGTETFPNNLMAKIYESDGFLVSVTSQIAVSMWVGYEIGGAHALDKPRAKYDKTTIIFPSVVETLKRLKSESDLRAWINRYIY